jgi:phage baseplate assembly protein gpV
MTTQQIGEEGFRWFIGIVEDIDDPKKLGRAKVRILNEHDEVETDNIPWAHVMMPTTSAGVEGVGETPYLTVGSRIVGFFMDGGEKQMPMIIGSFPTIPSNDDNKHSLSWLARGKNTINKQAAGDEPPSPYAAQYPYNKVIQTKSGHVIELDDTPENTRVHIYHNSGTYIEINNEGRIVIKSIGDNINVVGGNCILSVQGNADFKISGTTTFECDNVNITGDLKVTGEVEGKGVKLSTHTHGGVDAGNKSTLKPN